MQIDAGFQISRAATEGSGSGCVLRRQSLRLSRRNPICCRHSSGLIFGEAVHGTPLDRFRAFCGALGAGSGSQPKKKTERGRSISARRLGTPCTATLTSACARVAHPASPTTAPAARAAEAADQP